MRLRIGCPMRFFYHETRIEEMGLVDLHLHWGKICTEAAAQGKKCNWEKPEESELVIFFFFFCLPQQMFSVLFSIPKWGILSDSQISPYRFWGGSTLTKTGVWTLNKGTLLGWIFGNTLQIVGLQESTYLRVCF